MSGSNTPITPGTDRTTPKANNNHGRDTLLDVPDSYRQFQPGQFQPSDFAGQSSNNNEYGFVSGAKTNPTANYGGGGAPMVPNMQTADIQGRSSFPLTGGSEMFIIAGQKSFPSNAHPHPPFIPPAFKISLPMAPNTRLSSNQVSQNLGPGLAGTTSQSPSNRQQSQPPSQPPTPLPRLAFPFWGFHFQNFEQVNAYLNEVAWFPSMGRYGLPQSAEQYKFYLEKISSALLNIRNVWDIETAPWQLGKFLPNGEWTDARDTEAIAHIVVLAGMRIHVSGVTDFAHTRSVDYMSFNSDDMDFTFPQRMHFLAILLHHSKAAAAEVMARVNIDKYISAPITALRAFETFEENWNKASPAEQKNLIEVVPYVGSGVTHPPPELQAQLAVMATARYRQVHVARQGRDSGTGSTGNSKGQAPGKQRSPTALGTNADRSQAQAHARPAMPGSGERLHFLTPHPG